MRSCNVYWEDFKNHSKKTINELYRSQLYTDVTLVVNDGTTIPAHKFILGSSSSVLEKMLTSVNINNINNSIIFLPTVGLEDLLGVLTFIYLGEVKVSQDKLPGFFRLAADLKINTEGTSDKGQGEISNDVNRDLMNENIEQGSKYIECIQEKDKKSSNTQEDSEDKNVYEEKSDQNLEQEGHSEEQYYYEKNNERTEEQYDYEDESKNEVILVEEMSNDSNGPSSLDNFEIRDKVRVIEDLNRELKDLEKELPLQVLVNTAENRINKLDISTMSSDNNEECNRENSKERKSKSNQFNSKSKRARKSEYLCDLCDYKATKPGALRKHIELFHETKLEQCTLCPYEGEKQLFKKHLMIHEANFPCTLCHFNASTAGNLKRHIEEKHEGTKFPCSKCPYKASTPGHLEYHINLHCKFCDKVFFDRQEKEFHMKVHKNKGL